MQIYEGYRVYTIRCQNQPGDTKPAVSPSIERRRKSNICVDALHAADDFLHCLLNARSTSHAAVQCLGPIDHLRLFCCSLL